MTHQTHDEVLARRAVRLADPVGPAGPPPLRATGAQLRDLAAARAHRPRWRRLPARAAAAVAAMFSRGVPGCARPDGRG